MRAPIFPLHTVLFPGGILPLHIFEERYRLLVREGHDFAIVLIREGREAGVASAIHPIGTMGTVDGLEETDDGRFNLVLKGLHRVRIDDLDQSLPYLTGEVEALPEPEAAGGERLLALLEEYLKLHGLEVEPKLSPNLARRAVWLVGSVLQAEPIKRQRLLESGDAGLAEALLVEEVGRLKRHGRIAPLIPRSPSIN